MHKTLFLLGAAAGLVACGQSTENVTANNAAANTASAEKPKPYCFFKDTETKGWAAKRGKDGNITVSGKAYREDSRYKAVLNQPTVSGTTAQIAPTITQNDTDYGAPDNWWDVKADIANSASIDTVDVTCGDKTIAELKVPPKG